MMKSGVPAVLLAVVAEAAPPESPSRGSSSGLLLVANKGDHALGIVDPGAGRQIATVVQSGVTATKSRRLRTAASPTCRSTATPV